MSLKHSIKEFFKPSPRRFAKKILQQTSFVTVDVGAANGLIPHWQTLDGFATVVSFEPHEQSYQELLLKYKRSRYGHMYKPFNIGLSEHGGKTTLYMLNVRTGSSILPVDLESPLVKKDDPYIFPITETTIETKTLRQVFVENAIPKASMIKLDIQGAELSVLKGFGEDHLNDLLSIEMEVGFNSFHKGAPNPFEVIEALRPYHFVFFDMGLNRQPATKGVDKNYYLRQLNLSSVNNRVASRLVETDLIFFKDPDYLLSRGDAALIRKQMVAYCVYNFFGDACQLMENALDKGIFSKNEGEGTFSAIKEWSNIYHSWYHRAFMEKWHLKLKWLKSHLRHVYWQMDPREL